MSTNFIAEFDAWLFEDFRKIEARAAGGIPDAAELTGALLPWADTLARIASLGGLKAIQPSEAAKLHCFLNYALDQAAKQYQRCGASGAQLIATLEPIDDILMFLRLRAIGIA